MCESDRIQDERLKKYYVGIIHSLCNGCCVELKEKMWIQTETHGYEFTADKVMDMTDYRFSRIEIYGEGNFIHCSHHLLSSRQLRELARLVADAKLSEKTN